MPPSLASHVRKLRPEVPSATRRERLLAALRGGTAIAFVGSGCSPPKRYPSWDRFVIELGCRAFFSETAPKPGSTQPQTGSTDRDLLSRLTERLRTARSAIEADAEAEDLLTPDERYLLLSLAKERLDRPSLPGDGSASPYFDYFTETFGPRGGVTADSDTLSALLALPIRRFVTTNYDIEIEEALCRRSMKVSSFTQEPDFLDELTVFALSEEDDDRVGVFHCHGRYDRSDSIIATEKDYQRWYLGGELAEASPGPDRESALKRQGEATAFRQAIELLMSSNPILFVGSGLKEDDLLRPVRLLAALEPQRKQESRIFALLPRDQKDPGDLRHEILFEKYGIQVIPFNLSTAEDGGLAQTLQGLSAELKAPGDGAKAKPGFRKSRTEGRQTDRYWHHRILPGKVPGPLLGKERLTTQLEKIGAHFRGDDRRASVVVLSGAGGTGKSFHAARFVNEAPLARTTPGGYGRTFFWSSYYSDDFLAGVDHLLAFLDLDLTQDESRLDRLATFFRKRTQGERTLIVLDGIERLLVPAKGRPGEGHPTNAAVKTLFRLLAKDQDHTDVILTTRLVPSLYRHAEDGEDGLKDPCTIAEIHLDRLGLEDLVAAFGDLGQEKTSRLCSLLEGHTYALSLAARWLPSIDPRAVEEVLHDLSSEPPDRRPGKMIRLALSAAKENLPPAAHREAADGFVDRFLQHLAMPLSPVPESEVSLFFEIARQGPAPQETEPPYTPAVVLDSFESRGLLFRVRSAELGETSSAWTLHPTVRSLLFEPSHNHPGELLPNFTLAGFTSATSIVHPRSKQAQEALRATFDALAAEALTAGRSARGRSLCRTAFSVVRSRMEANTVTRWCSYEDYAPFLIELTDLARELSGDETWTYNDRRAPERVESENAPLQAGELAWLYNELGLVFCSIGDMRETYRIWEQGYEINRVIERGQKPSQFVVQSLLHLSHTFIERGRLDLAEDYLRQTEEANWHFGDDDYRARIDGYRGLLFHLKDDFTRAEDHYKKAVGALHAVGRNPRAESIFRRFYADLQMHRNLLDEARALLDESRALADAGEYPDLVAFCRNSLGRYFRAHKRFAEARREYQASWTMAREFGIRRLEADVLSELSRLALAQGDSATARLQAMRALRIANQLGLGLRRVHGLVVLGLASVAEKRIDLGKAYLYHARDLAFRNRYFLRGYEAQGKLEELGDPPGGNLLATRGTRKSDYTTPPLSR